MRENCGKPAGRTWLAGANMLFQLPFRDLVGYYSPQNNVLVPSNLDGDNDKGQGGIGR